jgi:hypothetical protein
MNNTLIKILFLTLPINLFGQIKSDTTKAAPIMLNKSDLKKVSLNLTSAGKNYLAAENLIILGGISAIIGSIIYTKEMKPSPGKIADGSTGKLFIGLGIGCNIAAFFCRYNGHGDLIQSGKDLENYSNNIK